LTLEDVTEKFARRDCLALKDGKGIQFRNVGNHLPLYSA